MTTSQLATGVSKVIPVERSEFQEFWLQTWWIYVKGWHALEFGILYWLTACAFTANRVRVAFLVSICYAFFDEFHQAFVNSRGGRLSDVCIDVIGIGTAWFFIQQRQKFRISKLSVIAVLFLIFLMIAMLSYFPFGSLEELLP